MYRMMSNEIKEKIIQELKKFFEEIKYNKDWVKAIEAMERAVNFGYKGDYSIIGRVYFDGVGNLLPNHKKAFEWLSRFYLDYKNGEIEDNIEAKTMLELCYDLSNLYVNCIILKIQDITLENVIELFEEMLNYASAIKNKSNYNTEANMLYNIGSFFYSGSIELIDGSKVKISKNFKNAYKCLYHAERLGNYNSTFLLAKMYEKGFYVEKNIEVAGKKYLQAAANDEYEAIKWCQKKYIDSLPWRNLNVWDKIYLPKEFLLYMKQFWKNSYVRTFEDVKYLKIYNIDFAGKSIQTLFELFFKIREYMENVIIYLQISKSSYIDNKWFLIQKNNFVYTAAQYEKIYKNIIRLEPKLSCFLENVKNIKPLQNGEKDIIKEGLQENKSESKKRIAELLLKRAICIAYKIICMYDLEVEDAVADASCGLVEGIDKYCSNFNANFESQVMNYVLKYMTKSRYNQSISVFSDPYYENWYYTIYPFIKLEPSYQNEIEYKKCINLEKINDNIKKYFYAVKISQLYEQKYYGNISYVYDLKYEKFYDNYHYYDRGIFYATRIPEVYHEIEVKDYLYEENLDIIEDMIDIERIIGKLDEKRQTIIKQKYFKTNSKKSCSYYKLSKQRINQIEVNAIEKIREIYRNGKLEKKNRKNRKREREEIIKNIDYFCEDNKNINYIKRDHLDLFMLEYYKRFQIDIMFLLKKIDQVIGKMDNEKWLQRKKMKVYSFKQTFIITRACLIFQDMDLEIIAEIIEKSLKHIKNLDIDNRVISWTIKRVDKFIELKHSCNS